MNKLITLIKGYKSAFILALLGVISQWWHIYYITYELSSLEGIAKVLQASILSLFLAGALLYFTLKSGTIVIDRKNDNSDTIVEKKEIREKYWNIVNIFATVDTLVNLYYWGNKIIITHIPNWSEVAWWQLFPAIVISILLPQTLKVYAGEVRQDTVEQIKIEDFKQGMATLSKLNADVDKLMNTKELELKINDKTYKAYVNSM